MNIYVYLRIRRAFILFSLRGRSIDNSKIRKAVRFVSNDIYSRSEKAIEIEIDRTEPVINQRLNDLNISYIIVQFFIAFNFLPQSNHVDSSSVCISHLNYRERASNRKQSRFKIIHSSLAE